MFAGIIAGITWAIETIIIGIALTMTPFVSTEQALFWRHLYQLLFMISFQLSGHACITE